ncbi:pectinesterase family protein [Uliginosibacterium sp. 31-16]|uniref:pectinesterase family protein n=1 Tax=Uliginosibacterium sp. 31-16 TaxID=3068315 RepID=UPI00273E6159|nr:pectinesterase family protein [Uliginosibacterium sp. 31-16]MDP5239832.1 pectinesterase family protein [Uliginosibacterium sp. 31-16]
MSVMRKSMLAAILAAGGVLAACGGNKATAPEAAAPQAAMPPAASCAPGIWFCENFESGSLARWDLLPAGGAATIGVADGVAGIKKEGANSYLQYDAGKSKGVVAALKDEAFASVKTADYFVEARIKPINNNTSNKFVCLLGRYQSVNDWLGACLNVQNGASSKVEFHKANGGKWLRARQFATRTIVNEQWYKLRLEMQGDTLNFYIDDDFAGSFKDASIAARGKLGLWLDNRSFAIDDIVVGDAKVKPVLMALDQTGDWNSEVGGADREITVAATKADTTPDSFSVASSDPKVVSVAQKGDKVVLHAVGAGSATITFTSGANPALKKTVKANIEPAFVLATANYGALAKRTRPAAGIKGAYVDGELALSFDAAPVLTGIGSLRIFEAKTDKLVDVIKPKGESNIYGPSPDGFYRGVNQQLMRVVGKQLIVRPHTGKLEYGKAYYVALSDNLLKDAKLAGKPFAGLGKKAGWGFTTRKAPKASLSSVVVDDDGSKADFRSVQGALDHAMKLPKEAPVKISVKKGVYEEILFLRGKDNVTIQGESREGTVIQGENYESLNTGLSIGANKPLASGGGRTVFAVGNADMLVLDRLTLKNTHLKKVGVNGQAETIYFAGEKERLIAKNANFISRQDTLQLNAYSWFYNTLIAGDVDFIWGSSKAALFENSEIRTVVDSTDATKGGYLVQARVTAAADKGYVFLNSRITREEGVPDGATVLARSAGSPAYFDNVVYVNSKIDKHVSAEGWWTSPVSNPAKATALAGWREFGSTRPDGTPLSLAGRVPAARTMTAEEAAPYLSREQVFATIGWKPQP